MKDHEIENLAQEVLDAYEQTSAPVNLAVIAEGERIELLEGDYGHDFHGRIEYFPEHGTFAIFHQRVPDKFPGRVRFTIAHELGHYFIDEHREILRHGITHNSEEGFTVSVAVENQADQFASALLIPQRTMKTAMAKRGFLTLKGILNLANDCQTSARATASRYVTLTEEPCLAILSKDGKIIYYKASEEAEIRRFSGLGNKMVPTGSATAKAAQVVGEYFENATSTTAWFSQRNRSAELWEEARQLGSSSYVLTLLSWKTEEEGD